MARSRQDKKLFDVYMNETKINQGLPFDQASAIVMKLNNDFEVQPEEHQEEFAA
jgi:hypothetical protein